MIWLRLVRWQNLLIIFMTQFLIWFCVMHPALLRANSAFLLSFGNFLKLSASTCLIAAAGYVINDYFDIKIDAINRPEKAIVERNVNRRTAIIVHTCLNLLGIAFAASVAVPAHKPAWLLMQIICTVLLFFYSSHLKRRFVSGNVLVALLTAFTVYTLYLYEPGLRPFLQRDAMVLLGGKTVANPVWVMAVYTWFAFILTWMREVVKDMEDHIGDAAEGCVTMPVKWGLRSSARFVQMLSAFALAPLIFAGIKVSGVLGIYILVCLSLPLAVWTLKLPKSAAVAHYAAMSRSLKWIMVIGICSLIIYYVQSFV